MANVVTVDFDGVDGTSLATYDAAFTKITGLTGEAILAGNRLRLNGTTGAGYYHSADAASADYSVSADVVWLSSVLNTAHGVAGRCSTSANTFYHARYSTAAGGWQLYKFVAGAATQLGSTVTEALSVDTLYKLTLDMSADTIRLLVNDVQQISAIDSAITATGKGGMRLTAGSANSDSTGIHLDNFSIDEAGGGSFQPAWAINSNSLIQGGLVQ